MGPERQAPQPIEGEPSTDVTYEEIAEAYRRQLDAMNMQVTTLHMQNLKQGEVINFLRRKVKELEEGK